jgi:hypothetical protein
LTGSAALSQGSWSQIEEDHEKVGLAWRPDLDPGWGKPKYVSHVLEGLPDAEVLVIARRTLERFPDRCAFAVEDAVLWVDAGGVARVSEVTRLKLASLLDDRRLHSSEGPHQVLDRFARSGGTQHFEYASDGRLCLVDVDLFALFDPRRPMTRALRPTGHLALLDAYGFREWPDVRLFRLIEFLTHPAVRQGDDQSEWVRIINTALAGDRLSLVESDQVSGHPTFTVRPTRDGVSGRPKNLIFASTGPKPELGFVDAVNNDVAVLRNGEYCLVYEDPIADDGLRWSQLVEWWAAREDLDPAAPSTRRGLGDRLMRSLASPPERHLFQAYFKLFRARLDDALPALIRNLSTSLRHPAREFTERLVLLRSPSRGC